MHVAILHTAFIGDLANIGTLVESLHQAGHEITLLSNKGGLALFKHDSRIRARVEVRKGNGLGKIPALRACAKRIAEERPDLLLVPHRSATSSLIARLSTVPRRVGFREAALSFLYDEVVAYPEGRHECLRILDLAPPDVVPAHIRAPLESRGSTVLQGRVPPEALFAAHPVLAEGAEYFVVSPGSVWFTKQYPVEKLAEVARSLLAEDPLIRCVVSGGPGDAPAVAGFLESLGNGTERARVLDATACVPLADLPSVLARASFSIANDSAPFHVACGVGTPVLGIYGPTSTSSGLGPAGPAARAVTHADAHGALLPCQPCSKHGHAQCPQRHFKCMVDLPPRVVVKVLNDLRRSLP